MREPHPTIATDDAYLDEAKIVALAYYRPAHLNGWSALVALTVDDLVERNDLEDRHRHRGRQISHGYVCGRIDA